MLPSLVYPSDREEANLLCHIANMILFLVMDLLYVQCAGE